MTACMNQTGSSNAAHSTRAYSGRLGDAYVYHANFAGDAGVLVNSVDLTTAYRPAVSDRDKPGPVQASAPRPWEQDALSMLARQVSDYEGQIAQLKASAESLAAERERWKQAAQQMEARPESDEVAAHGKYSLLKHTLAKLLHPDTAHGSMAEKSVREAIFTEFWSAVERIERAGNPAQA